MTRQELIDEAMEFLRNDDNVYCEAVESLDCWDGFADGYRCYYMSDLDDLYGDMKLSDFLDLLNDDFCSRDEYFYHDTYGLHSTDSKEDVYRDNTDIDEVFEALLDNWNHMDLYGVDDFEDIMDDLFNENYDDEDDESDEAPTDFEWQDEE